MRRGLVVVLLVLVVDIIAVVLHYRGAEQIVSDADPIAKNPFAVAIVFFGARDADTKARVDTAISAFENGLAAEILLVGGDHGSVPTGAEWMYRYAASQLSELHLHVPQPSWDTTSNLQVACAWLDARGRSANVLLISDVLHLSRIEYFGQGTCLRDARLLVSEASMSGRKLWLRVHFDWLSRLGFWLLPEERYSQILRWLRPVVY